MRWRTGRISRRHPPTVKRSFEQIVVTEDIAELYRMWIIFRRNEWLEVSRLLLAEVSAERSTASIQELVSRGRTHASQDQQAVFLCGSMLHSSCS